MRDRLARAACNEPSSPSQLWSAKRETRTACLSRPLRTTTRASQRPALHSCDARANPTDLHLVLLARAPAGEKKRAFFNRVPLGSSEAQDKELTSVEAKE